MTSIPATTVSAIDEIKPTQPPTQTTNMPSPTPSPTSLPSSFYEACVSDAIQGARESGTEPDTSWCARWNNDDDGPPAPTPRPTIPPAPVVIQTQRALTNTISRTRVPVQKYVPQSTPPRLATTTHTSLPPIFSTLLPRTTTKPLSALMRSTVSQILSRPPDYVAQTRSPAPAITQYHIAPSITQYTIAPSTQTITTTSSSPVSTPNPTTPVGASVPRLPFLVSFVHEDQWMNFGNVRMLTLRNGALSTNPHVPKDLAQIFGIGADGRIRVLDGDGQYVALENGASWHFTPRQLRGSYALDTNTLTGTKRLMYTIEKALHASSSTDTSPSGGWFIVPIGRAG